VDTGHYSLLSCFGVIFAQRKHFGNKQALAGAAGLQPKVAATTSPIANDITATVPEVWLQECAKAACKSCKHLKACCSHLEVMVLQQLHQEFHELWQLLQEH
jgi:hypothetical protein